MKTIAEGYLDIPPETVANIQHENQGDAGACNRKIIRYWVYRNPSLDQAKVILSALFSYLTTGFLLVARRATNVVDGRFFAHFLWKVEGIVRIHVNSPVTHV